MAIGEALRRAAERLQPTSDSPRLDAELLLCEALGKPRSYLYTWPEQALTDDSEESFAALVARRERGEPVAHILGRRQFWSLDLKVTSDTLIPRPESELLVETALALCPGERGRALDLGTGSGALALAFASERPGWQILGVDNDPAALQVAMDNGRHYALENVAFACGHWFDNLEPDRFDVIFANPPYVEARDPHLQAGDLRFEPDSALVTGEAGLADLRHIVRGAWGFLQSGAPLLVEHGWRQGDAVGELFRAFGYRSVETRKDLADQPRVTLGYQP